MSQTDFDDHVEQHGIDDSLAYKKLMEETSESKQIADQVMCKSTSFLFYALLCFTIFYSWS
jgi:hypothetical protein